MKKEEYIGKKFNMLTVLEFDHYDEHYRGFFKCKCDCGNEVIVRSDGLLSGNNKSCGCMYKSHISKGGYRKTHGDSKSRLYKIWSGMRYRCSAFGKDQGRNYADRGVAVCEEWKDFEVFRDWALKNGYEDSLTIDRIDVNGNYEPGNCRWATTRVQQRNKRDTIYVELGGERIPLRDACELNGISYHTAYQRIYKLGWSATDAIKKI